MKLWVAVAVALLLDVVGVLAPGWPGGAPGPGPRHHLLSRDHDRSDSAGACHSPIAAASPAACGGPSPAGAIRRAETPNTVRPAEVRRHDAGRGATPPPRKK
jgi:hypothetical protein